MAVLSDLGFLEQGIIDQLSGNDHSLKGAIDPTSRRTDVLRPPAPFRSIPLR
jgi:hypothetical protein